MTSVTGKRALRLVAALKKHRDVARDFAVPAPRQQRYDLRIGPDSELRAEFFPAQSGLYQAWQAGGR